MPDSKLHEFRRFPTLHIQNISAKAGQQEPAPNINALQFAVGQPRPAPAKDAAGTSEKSTDVYSLTPSRCATGSQVWTGRHHSDHGNAAAPLSESTIHNETSQQPEDGLVFPPGTKSNQTCPFWDRGQCRRTAETCGYQHRRTLYGVASNQYVGHKKKYASPPVTCHFWYRKGKCNDGDECNFAHWNTGLIANPPKTLREQPLELVSRDDLSVPRTEPEVRNLVAADSEQKKNKSENPLKRRNPAELTCYFWNSGYCNKSEKECGFAHRKTDAVAEPPGWVLTSSANFHVHPQSGRFPHEHLNTETPQALYSSDNITGLPPRAAQPNITAEADQSAAAPVVRVADDRRAVRLPDSEVTSTSEKLAKTIGRYSMVLRPPRAYRNSSETLPSSRDTCFFWARGFCKNGERCRFAHHDIGVRPESLGDPSRGLDMYEDEVDDAQQNTVDPPSGVGEWRRGGETPSCSL